MARVEKGGFQKDGSYVQQISRKTRGADGQRGWNPPSQGQKIITKRGPFRVKNSEMLTINGKRYFMARGKLTGQ